MTLRGDEGRGVTAISSGEVCSNYYIRRFPNGETLSDLNRKIPVFMIGKRTLGSETSQYQEEQKTMGLFYAIPIFPQ